MSKTPTRLLIVDDEPDTCANLSDIFSDLGYRVVVANDGQAALKLIGNNTFDVAILDLKMPGMDGLDLYRRIREISAGTVAIVVTAYASSNTAASVLEAGAWKLLAKPVKFPQLLELVNEAMNQPLVLVVDDDYDLCDSLWELFHNRAFRVCLAHDVPDAIKALKLRNYNVVVIDLKLPTGPGTKLLEFVRQANPHARSVMITGHRSETEELVEQALSSGANAVCYKPFDVAKLLEIVCDLSGKPDG